VKRIFISSVQGEFADERRMLKDYIEHNPVLRRFFDVFIFEDVPPTDRRADEVYLDELAKSHVYLALIGARYCGGADVELSPTEREYDEASRLGMRRIVLVDETKQATREGREQLFLDKISHDLTWHGFANSTDLLNWVLAALDKIMDEGGIYRTQPFDRSACEGAGIGDIDEKKVIWFVRQARALRGLNLPENASVEEVLTHFKLYADDKQTLSNSAILLFGKAPQDVLLSSEVKCVHWPTPERHKPILSYQVYRGTLFDLIDLAVEYVLARIDLSVGTRSNSTTVPREWEIPKSVIAEAIANAVAHRDYASTGSVQVELFPDKLVVMNPGTINPSIKMDQLFKRHASYPNNPRIADPLFYTKHIERLGTGLTDLIEACRAAGLPDPEAEIDGNTYSIIIYRKIHADTGSYDPVNDPVYDPVNDIVNDSISHLVLKVIRNHPGIRRNAIAQIVGVSEATVKRRLRDMSHFVRFNGAPKTGGYYVVGT